MLVSSCDLKDCHPSAISLSKRLLDIVGALVGLSLLAILFIPIAIAIKFDSPGPIFFTQKRCGLYGHPFTLWKLRSMRVDAPTLQKDVVNHVQGFAFKNENDPRITSVGRFLRRTSLDEFPQFWNVLRGEMSLVGTRPPMLEEVELYHSHHWQRLRVKPGLTGEWQVNGRSRVKDFEQVVALDLHYQKQWNFGYDCLLLFKTIYVVLMQVGAC